MTRAAVPRPRLTALPADALDSHPVLAELATPGAYMARNSRSFRFAAGLMPAPERERVARVYAWCRFTDDLVDRAEGGVMRAEARLDAWLARSQAAYAGGTSGIPLTDRVMREMVDRQIPFAYAGEVIAGVRSDLRFPGYRNLQQLRGYTYRVAGVIGRWLTELHGVRDPWMLERAAALGHAMQLTNILRDVGEDWGEGRLYLPASVLARHGLTSHDIGAMRRRVRPIDDAYRAVIEELMSVASHDYRAADEAIPHLPPAFRRSVAVAAAVYEGIHDVIRRNGYDNFGLRAVTSTPRKMALAAGALWSVARRRPLRAAL